MASLQCWLLPSSRLSHSSSQRHKILKPSCRVSAPTAKSVGVVDGRMSNYRHPPTHLATFHGNRNAGNPGANEDYVALINQFGRNSNYSSDCRQIHAKFLKLGAFELDNSLREKLVVLYSKNKESMGNARQLFDEIPERTAGVYAALIGLYCRLEKWEDLFLVFGLMVYEGMFPDKYLVPTILKACSATQSLRSGRMVHGYVTRKGLDLEIYVGNALIDLYANCGDFQSCRSIFDILPERDVVSWTSLFSAFMDGGLLDEAEEIFQSMQLNGVKPDSISWNAFISGYARNGEIDLAFHSLEQMQEKGVEPGVRSWNAIISGCVQSGYLRDALDTFCKMLLFPENPNVITIVSVLSACADMKDLNLGRAIHGCALKFDLCWNPYVQGSLIDMYIKCGKIDYAEIVFAEANHKDSAMWNEMIAANVNMGNMEAALNLFHLMQNDGSKPDVITYNTLLGGYARSGQKKQTFKLLSEMIKKDLKPNTVSVNILLSGFQQSGLTYEALKLFRSMQFGSFGGFSSGKLKFSIQPNKVTITSALAACAGLNSLLQGKEVHGHIVRNELEPNIYLSSALVNMYTKCQDMGSADKAFWRIKDRNTVVWNAYIAGHINNTQPEDAVKLFYKMLGEDIEPSSSTFLTLLPACGDMAALRVGRELHGYILKQKFDESTNIVASALIEMYAKCGCVKEAKKLFDCELKKDVVIWNAMMSAYTVNGMASDAAALFSRMLLSEAVVDCYTFTALLSACIGGCM